jgi:apolipoprotein N-acyltransferase
VSPVPHGALFRVPPLPLAALAGALSVLGFAPFGLYPLLIATLALLVVLWQRAGSRRHALLIGFIFGLGYFLSGVSWVYVSLHDFGAIPAPLAALLTLLFCCILAAYPAVIGYAYFALGTRSVLATVVVVPALWTLADWVRGWLFTGFPWIALGYSQVPASPLAGYVPVLGVYGATFATALTAGLVVTICAHPAVKVNRTRLLSFILHPSSFILAFLWIGGYLLQQIAWTTPLGTPLSVSLLQGNIPQEMKWRADRVT